MAKSFKLEKKESARLEAIVKNLELYITALAETWPYMTPAQKRSYTEHSPMFASLIELMRPFKDVI